MRTSTYALNEAYVLLKQRVRYNESDPRHRLMLELPQQENANNLAMMNALAGGEPDEHEAGDDLESTSIRDELSQISADLNDRWRGALFSLNPRNPDAARHFCASVREIFTQVLHTRAPDSAVLSALPACLKTDQGKPTRRARIHFLLHQKQMTDHALEDFVDKDIDNIIELFDLFNEGTHGEAGKLDLPKLLALKRRVEGAIIFATSIAN
jgi:Predicted pPIWI-associating nuclease